MDTPAGDGSPARDEAPRHAYVAVLIAGAGAGGEAVRAVELTTALRWIARMSEAGLFERVPDPADRRRAFMRLAPRASEAMRGYFAARARIDMAVR